MLTKHQNERNGQLSTIPIPIGFHCRSYKLNSVWAVQQSRRFDKLAPIRGVGMVGMDQVKEAPGDGGGFALAAFL
jgi:hypothetical protein